jgi:hypothetical protein
MGTELLEQRVVISGVGQSAIGRQADRSGMALTLDAIHAAVADAGLTMDDIDGLSMFSGGGAWIPVTQRAWAGLNPGAVYTKPLSVDEYLPGVGRGPLDHRRDAAGRVRRAERDPAHDGVNLLSYRESNCDVCGDDRRGRHTTCVTSRTNFSYSANRPQALGGWRLQSQRMPQPVVARPP